MTITRYNVPDGLTVDVASQNVIDRFKGWRADEIRADLAPQRSEAVQIFQNLTGDFNKATGIRNGNAFLVKETYIVGRRKYDPRGTVGTKHYEHVFHADNLEEVVERLHGEGYKVYAVDNVMEYNPVNLWDEDFPEKSAFLYGEEGVGLSEDSINMCDAMIYVSMYGSVRSLNVGSCSAVVLAEYSRKFRHTL